MGRLVVGERPMKEQQSRITLRLVKQVTRQGDDVKPHLAFWSSRFVYRPVSDYLTWLAVSLRLGPGLVTLFGALCLFVGAVCYASSSATMWMIGGILVLLFVVADHADGDVARFERWRRGDDGDRTKEFYDTCAHAGEVAIVVALALRFFVELDAPRWLLVTTLLFVFPGSIGPWRRYCETIVKYCAKSTDSSGAKLPPEAVTTSSFVRPNAEAGRNRPGRLTMIVSHIGRTMGSPDYILTLVLCTFLDVWAAVPALRVSEQEIPYLLIWLVSTSLYHAAAAVKSVYVYSRRLKSFASDGRFDSPEQ